MTKAEILAKITGHHADLLETAFLDNEAVTPREAFAAMEEYKNQPLEEEVVKEDEQFLKIIGDAFDAGMLHEYDKHFGAVPYISKTKEQYLQSLPSAPIKKDDCKYCCECDGECEAVKENGHPCNATYRKEVCPICSKWDGVIHMDQQQWQQCNKKEKSEWIKIWSTKDLEEVNESQDSLQPTLDKWLEFTEWLTNKYIQGKRNQQGYWFDHSGEGTTKELYQQWINPNKY